MATSARSVVLHQVTAFRKVWDDVGTGFRPYDATFFAPLPPAPNTFIVGDVIERGQKQSPSTTTAWAVSDSSNNPSLQPLLAAPIGFTRVWDTTHTSAKSPCSIWLPIPPSGYAALGCVVHPSLDDLQPRDRPEVVCVLREATRPAVAQPEADGYFVWLTKSLIRSLFSSKAPVAVWNVYPEDLSGISAGTFVLTQMPINDNDRRHLSCLAQPTAAGASNASSALTEAEIDAAFECVIEDTCENEAARAAMRSLDNQRKWRLVQAHGLDEKSSHSVPAYYIDLMKQNQFTANIAAQLSLSLRCRELSWVAEFVQSGGVPIFFDQYGKALVSRPVDQNTLGSCVACTRALLNTRVGLQAVLETANSIDILIDSLALVNDVARGKGFELVAAMTLVSPEARQVALKAMQPRMMILATQLQSEYTSTNVKTMAMMAINAVISQLPDAVARREFRARLNLVSAVDSLRSAAASDAGLAMQLNIFDQWSDERRMSVHENENDLQRASRVLKSKVLESHLIHAYFASILDHMVLLPCNGPQSLVYWEMIDRFVVHSASTSFNADKLAFAQEITDSVIRQLQTSSSWPPENLAELAGAAPPSTTAAAQEPPLFIPADVVALPPPPPLPPMMGAKSAVPKKPAIKPSVPLNGFPWAQMGYNDAKGTFWQDVHEDKVQLDIGEIEHLFQKATPNKPSAAKDSSAAAPPSTTSSKPAIVSLLDHKRAQNISIMLSRCKLSFEMIQVALTSLDERITLDQVSTLLRHLPNSSEIDKFVEYDGDVNLLSKPDRFMHTLIHVPHYETRLQSLQLKLSFAERATEIRQLAGQIAGAINDVGSNDNFKRLLEIILALGNYLNGGSFRGAAWGFHFQSLASLAQVKSINRGQTLLHYLAEYVERHAPDLLTLPQQLPYVTSACNVSLSELRAMEQKLKAELADLGKALANTEIDQQFVQAMKPFFDASTADMQNLSGVVAGVQSNFDALLKLFGEPSDTVSTELFGYVSAFLVDFAKAQDENKKRIAEKQRQANKPERKKIGGGAAQGAREIGLMDELIARMKNGSAFEAD